MVYGVTMHEATLESTSSDLANLLHQAARGLRRTWTRQLAPWDLTPFQWRALRIVARQDAGLRPGEIAEHLGIAPRSATEVVDQLEAKQLITRHPDPKDRRATQVEATPKGISVAQAVLSEREEHSRQYFGHLSTADQETLARLLRLLTDQDC